MKFNKICKLDLKLFDKRNNPMDFQFGWGLFKGCDATNGGLYVILEPIFRNGQ